MVAVVCCLVLGAAGLPAISQEDSLVAAAKREGTVTLYGGGHTREQATEIAQKFQAKYGIKVEVTRKPTGEVVGMVEAERKAGALKADVISVADPAEFLRWAPQGVLAKYQPPTADSFLPQLRDPSGYYSPYYVAALGLAYNTALSRQKIVPQSWWDLIDPRWKGKVVHVNPNTSGTAASFVYGMVKLVGWDWYQKLAANRPFVPDSALSVPQLILSGEALLGAPPVEPQLFLTMKSGEPIALTYPKEGVPVAINVIAALAGSPHPNAAKLLIAYHTSDEVQRMLSGEGARPILKGVPAPAGLPPLETLKIVVPDYVYLSQHVREQNAKFHQLIGR